MRNCFGVYFMPVYLCIKKPFDLLIEDDTLIFSTASIAMLFEIIKKVFDLSYFGVSNYVLILVIGTIFVDAYYGVKKSLKQSNDAKKEYDRMEESPEKRMHFKIYERQKFQLSKLQYTFFKTLTLLGYLFFAKHVLEDDSDGGILVSVIGFASGVLIKAPLVIFWYYDFKSIGNNSMFIYGKKAPIFSIVEKIFEAKISNFFNKNKDV